MKMSKILIFAIVVAFAISAFSISAYAATDNQCYLYDLDGNKVNLHEYGTSKTWNYADQMTEISILGNYVLYNGKPITLYGVPVKKDEVVQANTPYIVVDRDFISVSTSFNTLTVLEGDSWRELSKYDSSVTVLGNYVLLAGRALAYDHEDGVSVNASDIVSTVHTYFRTGVGVFSFSVLLGNGYTATYYCRNGFTWAEYVADNNESGISDKFSITASQVSLVNGCKDVPLYREDTASYIKSTDAVVNIVYKVDPDAELIVHKGPFTEIVMKEATCREDGIVSTRCDTCGFISERTVSSATVFCDWQETEVIKEATCTTPGEKLYTCSVCGDTKIVETQAKGHSLACGWGLFCDEKSSVESGSSSGIFDGITDGIDGVVDGFNDGLNKFFSVLFGIIFFFLVLKAIPLVVDIFQKIFYKNKRR